MRNLNLAISIAFLALRRPVLLHCVIRGDSVSPLLRSRFWDICRALYISALVHQALVYLGILVISACLSEVLPSSPRLEARLHDGPWTAGAACAMVALAAFAVLWEEAAVWTWRAAGVCLFVVALKHSLGPEAWVLAADDIETDLMFAFDDALDWVRDRLNYLRAIAVCRRVNTGLSADVRRRIYTTFLENGTRTS